MSPRNRSVLIDAGGVLVPDYLPGVAAAWGERLGLSPADFLAALYDGNDTGVLIGRVGEDAWWDTVRERLRIGPDLIGELRRDLAARETWDAALVARLRTLRGAGVPTAVVSNTWPGLRERMTDGGLVDIADELVLSCEVGCAKPDPRIYEIALGRLGAEPEGSLFIDDMPANVTAARALGMAGHVHTDTASTLDRIEEFIAPV
ncbi:HAD family phosphatase [Streptomyces sp. NPDC086554]|uniref:HAD family hydrolase n=1 Tax=Streptomyces sp. NPDC086554 TaxID=3154864 RepID=UPI003429BB87